MDGSSLTADNESPDLSPISLQDAVRSRLSLPDLDGQPPADTTTTAAASAGSALALAIEARVAALHASSLTCWMGAALCETLSANEELLFLNRRECGQALANTGLLEAHLTVTE